MVFEWFKTRCEHENTTKSKRVYFSPYRSSSGGQTSFEDGMAIVTVDELTYCDDCDRLMSVSETSKYGVELTPLDG